MPTDIFSGRPLVPSKCCGAGIISASFMDKTWAVCSNCNKKIKEKFMRATITDKDHPWYSYSGDVTEEEIKSTGQLVMLLDNGMKAGVYMRQVKELE